jgi:hypothetical protein
MYSFLINPSPGTVDKNPIGHTVHNSAKPEKPRRKVEVKRKTSSKARK